MKKSRFNKSFRLPKSLTDRSLSVRLPLLPSISLEKREGSLSTVRKQVPRISNQVIQSSRLMLQSPLASPLVHHKIEGIPIEDILQLYKSRCDDLRIPAVGDQKSRFIQTCISQLVNRDFCLPEQGLGPQSVEAITKILSNSDKFAFLNLSGNAISDKGALQIADLLQSSSHIVHLNIGANEITPEGTRLFLDKITHQSSLVSLDLSSADNKNRISGPGLISLANYVATNTLLTHLSLAGSLLCKEGINALSKGIKQNKSLLYLNLSNNLIGDDSRFWKAICSSPVQDLNVSNNKISESRLLEIALNSSSSIVKLDLSKNLIGDVTCIFEALRRNTSLKHLNLASNSIKVAMRSTVISSLKENSILDILNLACCDLSQSFVTCLGLGLASNTSLQNLNLSYNYLNDQAISSLAEGLSKNKTLKHLNLNMNRITNTGCAALVSSLQDNSLLSKLSLNSNGINNLGAEALFKLAKMNKNLLSVNIENNQGDLKFGKLISQTCEYHAKIQVKERVPRIKGKLTILRGAVNQYEEVTEQLHKESQKKRIHTVKLKKQMRRLKEMKSAESRKLDSLNKELLKNRMQSQLLSKQMIEIKNKSVHIDSRFAATERDMNLKIKKTEKELRKLEVILSKLKEAKLLKEYDQEMNIENKHQELTRTRNSLDVAKIKLSLELDKLNMLKKAQKNSKGIRLN